MLSLPPLRLAAEISASQAWVSAGVVMGVGMAARISDISSSETSWVRPSEARR